MMPNINNIIKMCYNNVDKIGIFKINYKLLLLALLLAL
jgi:hypothetical protein